MHRVIRSIILPSSTKCSKGYPHGSPLLLFNRSTSQRPVTFIHFLIKPGLKVSRIYPPASYRKHPDRHFGTPTFMFYVYGFDLSDKIWFVSIVMALVVTCLLGCVFSTILTGPPYIPCCLYRFPKWNMMIFIDFQVHHSSSATLSYSLSPFFIRL